MYVFLRLAYCIIAASFLILVSQNSIAQGIEDTQIASLQPKITSLRDLTFKSNKQERTASFCGACSNNDHSACGGQSLGWSCCSSGCASGKMQCWNVVSCDKIANLKNGEEEKIQSDRIYTPDFSPQILAQSNQCSNWYNNIQSTNSSYNSQCSGTLSQAQYDYCQNWLYQINSNVAAYNSQCL